MNTAANTGGNEMHRGKNRGEKKEGQKRVGGQGRKKRKAKKKEKQKKKGTKQREKRQKGGRGGRIKERGRVVGLGG